MPIDRGLTRMFKNDVSLPEDGTGKAMPQQGKKLKKMKPEDCLKVMKTNPYHDKSGLFTSKAKAGSSSGVKPTEEDTPVKAHFRDLPSEAEDEDHMSDIVDQIDALTAMASLDYKDSYAKYGDKIDELAGKMESSVDTGNVKRFNDAYSELMDTMRKIVV